jgi:hypothetical protein
MRAEELIAEFGIAGTLDFVETEHGLVKAVISLEYRGRAVPACSTADRPAPAGRAAGPVHQPQKRVRPGKGDPRRHSDNLPVVRSQPARASGAAARLRAYHSVAPRRGRDRGQRDADPDPQPR